MDNRGEGYWEQMAEGEELVLHGHLSSAAETDKTLPPPPSHSLGHRESVSFTLSPVPPGCINREPRGGLEQKVTFPWDSLFLT